MFFAQRLIGLIHGLDACSERGRVSGVIMRADCPYTSLESLPIPHPLACMI